MKTVCFVNMKGGVAKTTLSVNIAHALWLRENLRVLLVDLDPQFNATQCLFSGEDYVKRRQEGGNTVLDVFNDAPAPLISPVKGAKPQAAQSLDKITPWKWSDGVDVLPGDLELYRLDMGGAQGRENRLRRYLAQFEDKGIYDYVIIDTPPTPSPWMTSALLASQLYVVPVKPEPLSTVGIDLLASIIGRVTENHGHKIECVGVVLTMCEANTLVFKDAVRFLDNNNLWQNKRFKAHLPKRTSIARDQGKQQLILNSEHPEAKTAIARITTEFRQKIEQEAK
jgi:chromosome partitioning protein